MVMYISFVIFMVSALVYGVMDHGSFSWFIFVILSVRIPLCFLDLFLQVLWIPSGQGV